jgi:hypothetical protein
MEQQQQAWGLPLLGLSMIQFNSISVSLSGGSQNTEQLRYQSCSLSNKKWSCFFLLLQG